MGNRYSAIEWEKTLLHGITVETTRRMFCPSLSLMSTANLIFATGLINPHVFLSPSSSENGGPRTPLQVGTHPPPIPSLDPNRYRLLVQGSVKLAGKLSRRGLAQSSGAAGAKSASKGPEKTVKRKVQFSDESGYDLYILRSVTDLVSLVTVWSVLVTLWSDLVSSGQFVPSGQSSQSGQIW